jgi:hypothetical protein
MDKTELRFFALDEKERRRRVQRDYELAADGLDAPKVTVSAAMVADNPYTEDLLAKAALADKDQMFDWIAPGRSAVPLWTAQVRSLAEQVKHQDLGLQRYFERVLILIDNGAISTKEEIQNADWPGSDLQSG